MSDEKLIEIKELLDDVSLSMCTAKWQQVTLHLHNGHTHSCHHPLPHKIPLDELADNTSALHNTKKKKLARKEMLEGKRPEECQYCWNIEDLEGFSKNKFFSDRIIKSADDWAIDDPRELAARPWDYNVLPTYVEVSFSNNCNLKCSYCSPIYSSRWVEESQHYGPYPTSGLFGGLDYIRDSNQMPIHHKEKNPYVEAFWRWWPDLVNTLKVFRITGGEPLLSKDTNKILDYLNENPRPELELAINTNASLPHEIFDSFVLKSKNLLAKRNIKNLQLYASVDGWQKATEYSRFGLDFSLWQRNIEKYLAEVPEGRVIVMCTANIFSLPGFEKLLEYILKLKNEYCSDIRFEPISIDVAILRFPHHQCLAILTDEFKCALDGSLRFMIDNKADEKNWIGFYQYEIGKLDRLVSSMKEGSILNNGLDINDARSDFYQFVNEHDRRRGTSFSDCFPELKKFYDFCGKVERS